MAKKITKRQAKVIATIHSAILIAQADSFMFQELNLPDEDEEKIIEQIEIISSKLLKKLPSNFSGTQGIIDYAKSNH